MIFVWDWVSVVRDALPSLYSTPPPYPMYLTYLHWELTAQPVASQGPWQSRGPVVPNDLPPLTCASKSPFPF